MRADNVIEARIVRTIGGQTLLCLFTGAVAALSITMPYSEVFRPAIGDAQFVVVGSIAKPAPIDSTRQYQVSELLVEKVVVGDLQEGERLQVEWPISIWYAPPDTVYQTSTDYVNLAALEDVKTLWCLGPTTRSTESGRLRYLCDPLQLTEANLGGVESALDDLHAEQRFKRVRPEPDDMEERIAAVEAVLRSWLAER
jgi:hypothetical protein